MTGLANGDEELFPTSAPAPVLFADGVMSHAWGPAVSKFYLYRTDPHFRGVGTVQEANVAQIVMTNDGFVSMCAFVEARLRAMIASGTVKIEDVNRTREKVGLSVYQINQ